MKLRLQHVKKVSSIKLQLLELCSLIHLSISNGSIMVWSTITSYIITLLPSCCLLLVTGISKLEKSILWLIHEVYQMSLMICLWKLLYKSLSPVFLGAILMLQNICFCKRRLSRRFFYRFYFVKNSTPTELFDFHNCSFFKDLNDVQKRLFLFNSL